MHHEQDMRKMGNLRKYMPVTFVTMGLGWLAICGIPIWAGFFSKDEILYRTFAAEGLGEARYVLWVVGLITAVLTACYMTRLMVMTFYGEERFHLEVESNEPDAAAKAEEHAHEDDEEDEHHHKPHDFKPHESSWLMTLPLIILAVLSTVGGLVGVPYAMSSLLGKGDINVFEQTLEPVIAHVGVGSGHAEHGAPAEHGTAAKPAEHVEHNAEEISTERMLAGLSVLLALSGIGIGIALFKSKPLRKMPKILEDKWRIDELYNGYVVDPITNISTRGLWKGFDLGFVDGIVNGIGHFVIEMGSLVRQVQVGFVRSYAAIILVGALAVLGYFIYYGLKLVG